MATRGRKPTPTHLKVVTGNPGRRPLPANEPQGPAGVPDCPPHLQGLAREEWDRLAPALAQMGVLTLIDGGALALYCQAWSRWVQAEQAIAKMAARDQMTGGLMIKTANGNPIQNPLVGIANKAMADCNRYAAELGITPSSRSRIAAVGDSNATRNDPTAKFGL